MKQCCFINDENGDNSREPCLEQGEWQVAVEGAEPLFSCHYHLPYLLYDDCENIVTYVGPDG